MNFEVSRVFTLVILIILLFAHQTDHSKNKDLIKSSSEENEESSRFTDNTILPLNIYELLIYKHYSKLITSYCPEEKNFFTKKRKQKYCTDTFDNLVSNRESSTIDCKNKSYFLTKKLIGAGAEAREVTVMTTFKEHNLRKSLILAEDCVYKDDMVILIHPKVTSLANMLPDFKIAANDFNKKLDFMINLVTIYSNFAKNNLIHGTVLLAGIVVDPQNISNVSVRSFYCASFTKAEYDISIINCTNYAAINVEKHKNLQIYFELQRLVRLLIVIQDYINSTTRSCFPHLTSFINADDESNNTLFNEWCKKKSLSKTSNDDKLNNLLCEFNISSLEVSSFTTLLTQLNKIKNSSASKTPPSVKKTW